MKKKVAICILILFLFLPISYAYEINYYHNDHLGSPAVITDQSRNRVYSIDYKPFGQSFNEQGDSRFTYNSKEEDNTGLHYYGARYYDADIGRFITTDPLGGSNVYVYTRNNPLKYIDPSGMDIRELIAKYQDYKLYAIPGPSSGVASARGARLESPREPIHAHIFLKNGQQLPRINLETGAKMDKGKIPKPLIKRIRKNLPELRERANNIIRKGKTSLGPISLAITAIFLTVDVAFAEENDRALAIIDALDPFGAIGEGNLNSVEESDLFDPNTGFDYFTGECIILELCEGKILDNGVVREIQCGDPGFIGPCQEKNNPGASQVTKTSNVKPGEDIEKVTIDGIDYGPS